MTTEKSIETAFRKKAHAEGWMTQKLDSGKLSNGWPDRLVCLPRGVCVFIEFKTKTGKVTPLQAHRHNQLRQLGQQVHVCRSANEAMEVCRHYVSSD